VILAFTISIISPPAVAQVSDKLNFSGGAGFSSPVQSAGNSLNTGWNLDFRGGYNAGQHVDADLDFNYNHFGLNSAALKRFGEPDGSVSVWSLTFQPALHLLPRRSAGNAYATAGLGIFDRNLTLTQPTVLTTIVCDPFFGCYPVSYGANQIVASFSTVKPGFNVGSGLEFRLHDTRAKLFAEARYQRVFTAHGNVLSYVPLTFGIRW
jgi:Outer membrane protein beta-barrel domain